MFATQLIAEQFFYSVLQSIVESRRNIKCEEIKTSKYRGEKSGEKKKKENILCVGVDLKKVKENSCVQKKIFGGDKK